MKSQFIVFGACALALIACNSQDSKPAAISANSTDDQKFAYMVGTQFGTQNFKAVPVQAGEHINQDCLIQAIFDNVKANKDSSFKVQIPVDSLSAIANRYNMKARARLGKAQPDSAAVASFEGSQEKYRAYVDSVLNSLPVEPETPVTGQPVVLGENPSENQKFSYLLGMQISNQFINISVQFQTDFDAEYFVLGIKDAASKVRDTNFVMPLPPDTLNAVGNRYNEKMKVLREEAVKKAQEEEAKLKEAVAGLRGDTLPNGLPVKMNFKVKVTGISTKDENLEAYAGKPLLISYFSATCGHCAHAAPQVVEMAKEFVPKGLTAITVFSGGNNKPGIRKFMDNAGYDDNEKVVWDESRQFGELYSDGYVPKIYLVNPDGTYKQYAAFEKEKEDLKKEIAELLNGKKVEWKIEVKAPVADSAKAPEAKPEVKKADAKAAKKAK